MSALDESYTNSHVPVTLNSGIIPVSVDQRPMKHKIIAVTSILLSVLLERIAYYALVSNLVINLQQKANWSTENSNMAVFIFEGTGYTFTLIFAILSDARLGRARTTFIGFFFYIVGYILITIIAKGNNDSSLDTFINDSNSSYVSIKSTASEKDRPAIFTALIVSAIGAGAVKSSIAVLGAEQMHQTKFISQYFDIYYCVVNVGSIIGTVLLTLLSSKTCYHIVYIIATIALVFSALTFALGLWYCRHTKPSNTVVINLFPVVWYALRARVKVDQNRYALSSNDDTVNSLITNESSSLIGHERPKTFLDLAKHQYQGVFIDRTVDDVKALCRALLMFCLLIPYWLVYSQGNSTFKQQGKYMQDFDDKFYICIQITDSLTIIVLILILNVSFYRYVNPRIRNKIITLKFIIGMILAGLSMITAGIIETQRQALQNSSQNISKLSIYTQIPQNIFMGSAETFTSVASFEFAYFSAPTSAQSLFMSLHFFSAGVASFLSQALIAILSRIYENKDTDFDFNCLYGNCQQFYVYFFVLAALLVPFMIIIYFSNRKQRLIQMHEQQMGSMG